MNFLLSAALALALGGLGWMSRISEERLKHMETRLAAARTEAGRWRAASEALRGRVSGQSALAEACLRREAAALEDAAVRDAIPLLGPSALVSKEEKDKGVSHATRRAAADYLNRPLE